MVGRYSISSTSATEYGVEKVIVLVLYLLTSSLIFGKRSGIRNGLEMTSS